MQEIKFQIFGSKSSIDCDIIAFVDNLSNIDDNHKICKNIEEILLKKNISEKPLNINLGVLKNNKLIDVFKGTIDEVNNSLFYTYFNHIQFFDNHIKYVYDRKNDDCKHKKILRCARVILSFFSRNTDFRKNVKNALRGDLIEKINVLKTIDYSINLNFGNKKQSVKDIYKTISFQYAQTLSLYNDIETYTKEDMIIVYPELYNLIYRKDINKHDLIFLNNINTKFIEICQTELTKMKKTVE